MHKLIIKINKNGILIKLFHHGFPKLFFTAQNGRPPRVTVSQYYTMMTKTNRKRPRNAYRVGNLTVVVVNFERQTTTVRLLLSLGWKAQLWILHAYALVNRFSVLPTDDFLLKTKTKNPPFC